MPNEGEFRNRTVVFVRPDDGVAEAARSTREHHGGDVVVVEDAEGARGLIGIATDRDIVVSSIGSAPGCLTTPRVGGVTGHTLRTRDESDLLAKVLKRTRTAGVRRVPVVDGEGVLFGIIAFDDLVEREHAREAARCS